MQLEKYLQALNGQKKNGLPLERVRCEQKKKPLMFAPIQSHRFTALGYQTIRYGYSTEVEYLQ